MDQHLGMNRTGMDMSPIHSKEMLHVDEGIPQVTNGGSSPAAIENYFLENADPLGSVPLPGTIKGAAKSTMKMATGHHPEVFINKLGERLAYERSGVRIYQQLIAKCTHAADALTPDLQLPIERMQQFCRQEEEHFDLLTQCLKKLGADPTAQTPDADASGVAASGLMKVITDPRTSISQCLQAMLAIELADNAAWELLILLAQDMGMTDMAQQFEHALQQEDVHLREVRDWYEKSVRGQAKMSLLS
jgi:Domain of unknown function (DUF892).